MVQSNEACITHTSSYRATSFVFNRRYFYFFVSAPLFFSRPDSAVSIYISPPSPPPFPYSLPLLVTVTPSSLFTILVLFFLIV